MLRIASLALVLHLGSASAAVAATCSARSPDERLHLVELYTSEGCDSCPPAERWMSSLRQHPEFVGLEFHVNYWDSSDWRDPFDDAAYSERQQVQSRRTGDGQIYTPQVWLDGRDWHNWPKGAPPSPAATAAPMLQLSANLAATVQVRVDAEGGTLPPGVNLYVALTEDGLSSAVRGGENRGKNLQHDQVVRAFAGPLGLPHAAAELRLPPTMKVEKSSVVAFAQDGRDGSVLQVARLPLAGCNQ
jgi:hypothetical protein